MEHVRFTPTKDLGEYMAKLLGGTDDMRAQETAAFISPIMQTCSMSSTSSAGTLCRLMK